MKKELEKLISELCKAEGGKSSIKVGDMREAVKKLAWKMALQPDVTTLLLLYGKTLVKKSKGGRMIRENYPVLIVLGLAILSFLLGLASSVQ